MTTSCSVLSLSRRLNAAAERGWKAASMHQEAFLPAMCVSTWGIQKVFGLDLVLDQKNRLIVEGWFKPSSFSALMEKLWKRSPPPNVHNTTTAINIHPKQNFYYLPIRTWINFFSSLLDPCAKARLIDPNHCRLWTPYKSCGFEMLAMWSSIRDRSLRLAIGCGFSQDWYKPFCGNLWKWSRPSNNSGYP